MTIMVNIKVPFPYTVTADSDWTEESSSKSSN